jgi:hypothetical protein
MYARPTPELHIIYWSEYEFSTSCSEGRYYNFPSRNFQLGILIKILVIFQSVQVHGGRTESLQYKLRQLYSLQGSGF